MTRDMTCAKCGGKLFPDYLDLAEGHCLYCGDRYDGGVPIRRPPTEEERARTRRVEVSERVILRRVK